MARRRWVVVALLAGVLAGCGSGASGPRLSTGQRAGLLAQLEAVRVPAAAHDVSGTESALRRFRASIAGLERAGALDAQTARRLRLGAARVLARVKSDKAALQPPPAPTPTPTPTAPAPAPPPGRQKHEKHPKPPKDHGKGPGKKHGKGGD